MQAAVAPEAPLVVHFAPYGTDQTTGLPYRPHPTQAKIRDWALAVRNRTLKTQGIPILYVQHGVDAGGTRGILTPLVECLFEYPGLRALIGRKDYQDLRLSGMETFFEIMPRVLLSERDEQEHRYTIRGTQGNSTLFFRELKDVKGLGSQEFSVIAVLEAHEIELAAYRTLKQRCRQTGYPLMILMEGNPPAHGHWLTQVTDKRSPDYDPDLTLMTLSSYENWDYMTPAYRSSLESMPPAWRRRYLLGETGALPDGTPVYPSFVEAVHVRQTHLVPDRPIIRMWDFGMRRAACLWAQMEDNNRLLIHKEWMALETPEESFIDGVIVRTNSWFGQRPCRDYGDPAARNRDPNGVSTLQRLQAKGIQLTYRVTTYGQRIPLINRKLSEMIVGEPAVVINPACPILIEGLSGGYHYPELKEGMEFTDKRDAPLKEGWFEHLCNAFEYGMVNLYGQGTADISRFLQAKRRNRFVSVHQQREVFF